VSGGPNTCCIRFFVYRKGNIRKEVYLSSTVILGGGVTGLCAGYRRKRAIYEGQGVPGGLCASYYVSADGNKDRRRSYRFEKGGGHWIFGHDKDLLQTVNDLSPVKKYTRRASVYFPDLDLRVPYPFQNHLYLFPKAIRDKVKNELRGPLSKVEPVTLHEWMIHHFGNTLCELFFLPFHELYTAGLSDKITPEDLFKNPSNRSVILQGLTRKTTAVGYNVTYLYPKQGLDHLMGQIEGQCDINYNKRAEKIDVRGKNIFFKDGSEAAYKKLISTVPLSEMTDLCGFKGLKRNDPYTSVLVYNIGARKAKKCPTDHWVYVPQSQSGFHRIGFYSNVDAEFLPRTKGQEELVSIYVEKAFLPGQKPGKIQIDRLGREIIEELKSWQYIKEAEVISPTWIEHAYTWQRPRSGWKQESLHRLKEHNIHSIGRYGAWKFQGILDSMRDGFLS